MPFFPISFDARCLSYGYYADAAAIFRRLDPSPRSVDTRRAIYARFPSLDCRIFFCFCSRYFFFRLRFDRHIDCRRVFSRCFSICRHADAFLPAQISRHAAEIRPYAAVLRRRLRPSLPRLRLPARQCRRHTDMPPRRALRHAFIRRRHRFLAHCHPLHFASAFRRVAFDVRALMLSCARQIASCISFYMLSRCRLPLISTPSPRRRFRFCHRHRRSSSPSEPDTALPPPIAAIFALCAMRHFPMLPPLSA